MITCQEAGNYAPVRYVSVKGYAESCGECKTSHWTPEQIDAYLKSTYPNMTAKKVDKHKPKKRSLSSYQGRFKGLTRDHAIELLTGGKTTAEIAATYGYNHEYLRWRMRTIWHLKLG